MTRQQSTPKGPGRTTRGLSWLSSPKRLLPAQAVALEYFLEVELAKEVVSVAASATRFESVVHYAENDASLFKD